MIIKVGGTLQIMISLLFARINRLTTFRHSKPERIGIHNI